MLSITFVTSLLMAVLVNRSATLTNGAEFINEFALDELTNADEKYQPLSFAAHSRPLGLVATHLQQQQHQHQHQLPNQVQLIGKPWQPEACLKNSLTSN